jgi:hypothetical protein
MIKYKNSRDKNHRSIEYQEKRSAANAVRIDSITSKLVKKEKNASHVRCQKCKSINALDGDDLLDLNGKRHFCEDPDRIADEVKCVTQIQQIIEYYNRRELSSFQLELNIT